MVAPRSSRRIHCEIVALADCPVTNRLATSSSRKPSQLLPWADPYIARLVERLQAEVRADQVRDRRHNPMSGRPRPAVLAMEAEPPRGGSGVEFDSNDLRFDTELRRPKR